MYFHVEDFRDLSSKDTVTSTDVSLHFFYEFERLKFSLVLFSIWADFQSRYLLWVFQGIAASENF